MERYNTTSLTPNVIGALAGFVILLLIVSCAPPLTLTPQQQLFNGQTHCCDGEDVDLARAAQSQGR